MSLDVYLTQREKPVTRKGTGVFVRDGGANRELTAEEVAARWPGASVAEQEYETEEVYSANITHNLNQMADAAGIYQHLWRPDEIGVTTARELIEPLKKGLALLKSDPPRFEKYNATNGWGLYEHFVLFVEDYLEACKAHPDAIVRVSR